MPLGGSGERGGQRCYRVAHAPFVFVRAAPSTDAEMLTVLLPRSVVAADAERDGWLRLAEPLRRGRVGWVLREGARIGLGTLMESVE